MLVSYHQEKRNAVKQQSRHSYHGMLAYLVCVGEGEGEQRVLNFPYILLPVPDPVPYIISDSCLFVIFLLHIAM